MKLLPLLISTLVGLSGCSGGPIRKEAFAGFESANPDKALIYFYRPKAFTGGGVWYDIKLSNDVVAALDDCSFAKVSTAPGTFTLSTDPHPFISGAPDSISILAEAGRRYFYLLDINGSFASAPGTPGLYGYTRIGWQQTSAKDAEKLLAGCHRVEKPGG